MHQWVIITDGVFGREVHVIDDRTQALAAYDKAKCDEYIDTVMIAQVLGHHGFDR